SSSSDAAGIATVNLYFVPGTDPDTAQVQVQNKVQLATPSLPQTVQQQGLTVTKSTRNFIATSVLDPIRRVTGVGEANTFGTENAMRIWLDPSKLSSFSLTSSDVQ